MAVAGLIPYTKPTDCLSSLGPSETAACIQSFVCKLSEIQNIYLSDIDEDPEPVGGAVDFSNATAFEAAIGDSGASWRCFCGIGSKPAAEKTTIELSKCRTKCIRATHNLTFAIDETNDVNYATLCDIEAYGWEGRMVFATGDSIYGGEPNKGIRVQIDGSFIWNTGKDEILRFEMTISWEGKKPPILIGPNPFAN